MSTKVKRQHTERENIFADTSDKGLISKTEKELRKLIIWRKGNPFALLVGMQTGTATLQSIMEITQKIKNGSVF